VNRWRSVKGQRYMVQTRVPFSLMVFPRQALAEMYIALARIFGS
jgi:hypothetical protein